MPVLLGFLRQEHGRPPRHRWGWGQFWHLQAGVWLCPGCWVKDWGLYHRLYWHSEPLNIGHFGVFRRENDGFLNFPPGGEAPLRFGWNQCRTSPILYIFQDQSFFCWQVWPPISSHFGNSRYTCLLSNTSILYENAWCLTAGGISLTKYCWRLAERRRWWWRRNRELLGITVLTQ